MDAGRGWEVCRVQPPEEGRFPRSSISISLTTTRSNSIIKREEEEVPPVHISGTGRLILSRCRAAAQDTGEASTTAQSIRSSSTLTASSTRGRPPTTTSSWTGERRSKSEEALLRPPALLLRKPEGGPVIVKRRGERSRCRLQLQQRRNLRPSIYTMTPKLEMTLALPSGGREDSNRERRESPHQHSATRAPPPLGGALPPRLLRIPPCQRLSSRGRARRRRRRPEGQSLPR